MQSMKFSYSRIECFKKCPYQFKLRYLDEWKTIKNQEPANALYLGNAIHKGLETHDTDEAVSEYKGHYYVMNNLIVNEQIKLEKMLHKSLKLVDVFTEGFELIHEYEIVTPLFRGFVDLIVMLPDGTCAVIDYKYSNNEESYMRSGQLHVYKYFLEKEGFIVTDLYYLFIPKTMIRQKKTEDLHQFRERLKLELEKKEPYLKEVNYDQSKVNEFLHSCLEVYVCEEHPKNQTRLCDWCEYKSYCIEGEVFEMNLPSTERRKIDSVNKKVMWWYGSPFSGKTTFANEFPTPLMLNTDGNIKFVDAPYISIKNMVEMDGRLKKETLAWEVFKDTIEELEKKQNGFQTLVIDLLEDLYEHCRVWGCRELEIDHESDNSFKAYDFVRSEFLRTMNRLCNLDYENIILISHEDISKDIMKKSGDKITRIAPNIPEKIANKIAGMVDFVGRIVADGNTRTLTIKGSDVEFCGGRLQGIKTTSIGLNYAELLGVYDEVNTNKAPVECKAEPVVSTTESEVPTEAPKRRTRKKSEDN